MSAPTTTEGMLAALLLASSPVAAIAGQRIHPSTEPQSVPYPKITYTRWGTESNADVGGYSNDGPTGYELGKFFVDCWATDSLTSIQLANAVKAAIRTFQPAAGVTFVIRVVDQRTQPGQEIPGQNTPIQRQTLDVRVGYQGF